MQSEEEQFVILKFKRHGHPINRKSLERTISWLKESSEHSIDILLKKLNQLALDNHNPEENLQHALQILSRKGKGLNSYEDLLEETRKRSIYAISPYQKDNDTWFCERPKSSFFEFRPEQKLKVSQQHFKRICANYRELPKDTIIGVAYENYSLLNSSGKPKIMLQNEANEFELGFPKDYTPDCLVVPGCVYMAEGRQEGKDLAIKLNKLYLPISPPEEKQSLLKQKFRQMCNNIAAAKQTIGYDPEDFNKYNCVHTPSTSHLRPTLIFGNVTISNKSIERIKRLVDAYGTGVSCIIMMLSADSHQSIDLGLWLQCKVYLIPHMSSDGPKLLPKLPLLKTRIPGALVLTNPAKISLEGRQVVLANYPLVKNIFSQSLIPYQPSQSSQSELVGKVSDLMFSQGTIVQGGDFYWPQVDYFNIHSETILVVTDSIDGTSFHKSRGKIGGLANTGNFDRDGDFICLMSWSKNPIQFCEERSQ